MNSEQLADITKGENNNSDVVQVLSQYQYIRKGSIFCKTCAMNKRAPSIH